MPRDPNEPVRLNRIYTGGGDRGQTSLGDGIYANRTSDLLFILARVANVDAAHGEPLWRPGA